MLQTRSEMRMKIPLPRQTLWTICGCRSQDVASRVDLMNIRSMALLLHSGAPTGLVEKVHTNGYIIYWEDLKGKDWVKRVRVKRYYVM